MYLTHAGYDRAAEQMAKIIDFTEADMQGKQKLKTVPEIWATIHKIALQVEK